MKYVQSHENKENESTIKREKPLRKERVLGRFMETDLQWNA
jgi:hypothetical protein